MDQHIHDNDKIEEETVYTDTDSHLKEDSIETEQCLENAISRHRKTKERKIGQIMDIVIQWRKMYHGYVDPVTGSVVKMSLEASAAQLGMYKKSLDDYLLHIRFCT